LQEVDDIRAAVPGVALLTAEPLGFHHGDALQSNLVQRFPSPHRV
jgi:hypothetical protein